MTEAEAKLIFDNIVILPQLQKLIRPLKLEEFEQLTQNLLSEGIRDSLIFWKTTYKTYYELSGKLPENFETDQEENDLQEDCYVLVDGHNRYQIARTHGLDVPMEIRTFKDIEEVKAFMINLQLGRRNATPEEMSYYRGLQYKNEKGLHGGSRESSSSQNDNLNGKKTIERVAEQNHVSPATIARDEKFYEAIELIKSNNKDLAFKILNKDINVRKTDLYNFVDAVEKGYLFPPLYNEFGLNILFENSNRYLEWYKKSHDIETTPKQKEDEFWKKQEKAERNNQSLFMQAQEPPQEKDFFDRGEEEKQDFEQLYKAVFKEVEYYKERTGFFKEELDKATEENNELKQQISNLSKDFKLAGLSERKKFAEFGITLLRAYSNKKHYISEFCLDYLRNEYVWQEKESFFSKEELDKRVAYLMQDNSIIFEK